MTDIPVTIKGKGAMPSVEVPLYARLDTERNELTLIVNLPAPPIPPGVREDQWFNGRPQTAELVLNVQKKSIAMPLGYYRDPDTLNLWEVQWDGLQWVMPGRDTGSMFPPA